MRRFKLWIFSAITAGAVPLTLMLAAPSASAAYGNTAEYQITFSQNCNNASLCLGGDEGLGGDWGWAVLNNDGTGDLEITFCGHVPGVGGGAGHASVDITGWTRANGVFVITGASDPEFVGPTPIPDQPGQYHEHPAPGVNMEITVTKIPNR
jgi:hypothetical protein